MPAVVAWTESLPALSTKGSHQRHRPLPLPLAPCSLNSTRLTRAATSDSGEPVASKNSPPTFSKALLRGNHGQRGGEPSSGARESNAQ